MSLALKRAAELLEEKLGENMVCFNLEGISSVTDFFVVATARSDTHVRALTEHLLEGMKKSGFPSLASEGLALSVWTCVDFGEIFVHIMRSKERELYNLEGIWGAAPKIRLDNL